MVYVIHVCWQFACRIRTELQFRRDPVRKLSRNLYVLLCVQWKTPVDGQRNCPKHVEFYSKNKFEKLLHLVGFIVRIQPNVFMFQVSKFPWIWTLRATDSRDVGSNYFVIQRLIPQERNPWTKNTVVSGYFQLFNSHFLPCFLSSKKLTKLPQSNFTRCFYGCQTCCLVIREQILRIFVKRELRRILGHSRQRNWKGEWRHSEKHHDSILFTTCYGTVRSDEEERDGELFEWSHPVVYWFIYSLYYIYISVNTTI